VIRVRVRAIEFAKAVPAQKLIDKEYEPPLKIIGTIAATGLGALHWWQENNEGDDEDTGDVKMDKEDSEDLKVEGGGMEVDTES